MKVFISIVILTALPCVSSAQRSPAKNSNDCPLARWSTTGAACQWAPDLPPPVESKFKSGTPIPLPQPVHDMNGLNERLPLPVIPIPDSTLKKTIRIFQDSTLQRTTPDNIIFRRLQEE